MIKFPIITTSIINLMMVTMVTSQAVLWDGSIVPPPSNSVCRLYGLPPPPCLLFTTWASWLWLLALLVWLQFKIAMYHTHTLNLIHKRKSSALFIFIPWMFFIGPRSDLSQPLSVTNWLTHWGPRWNMQTMQTMQTIQTMQAIQVRS